MKIQIFVPVFILIGTLFDQITKIQARNCFENLPFYTQEIDIQKETEQLILDANNKGYQLQNDCLNFLLKRGFHQQAIYMYENHFFNVTEKTSKDFLNNGVRIINSQTKRDLDQFVSHFHSSRQPIQVVEPAFQWAQSNSSIFIYGKLGLRIDSPACLTCRIQNIDISENHFNYTSYGIYSHMPVAFNLYLEFEEPIVVDMSIYKDEAVVGTLYFEFTKKEQGKLWHKPATNLNKKVAIWWDMREKHRKVMDAWTEMIENESYEEEKAMKTKRKEERMQKKKARQEKKDQKKAQKQAEQQAQKQKEEDEKSWMDKAKEFIPGM